MKTITVQMEELSKANQKNISGGVLIPVAPQVIIPVAVTILTLAFQAGREVGNEIGDALFG